MPKQNTPKSHIVPKVYLKKFTNSNGKLHKIRKDLVKYTKSTEIHPSGVCYQKGFYQFSRDHPIPGYNIEETNILEEYGFLYENKIGKIIAKLIKPSNLLPIQEIVDFSSILFDIKARNQYMRQYSYSTQNINSIFDDLMVEHKEKRQVLEPILAAQGSSYSKLLELTEGLRQHWTKDEIAAKELHNRALLENKINPSPTKQMVFNKLARGHWTVLKTTLNHQFITSDNPGYCIDSNNNIHNTRFIGEVYFFFPLTPYHLLIILMDGDQIESLPSQKSITHTYIETGWAQAINQITWQLATKEVYAAHEKPLLQTWASLHSSLII